MIGGQNNRPLISLQGIYAFNELAITNLCAKYNGKFILSIIRDDRTERPDELIFYDCPIIFIHPAV